MVDAGETGLPSCKAGHLVGARYHMIVTHLGHAPVRGLNFRQIPSIMAPARREEELSHEGFAHRENPRSWSGGGSKRWNVARAPRAHRRRQLFCRPSMSQRADRGWL